jgi:hypothetical protein
MPVVAISREESVSVAMAACDLTVMSRTIALCADVNRNSASTGQPFAGSLRTLVGRLFCRIDDVAAPPTRATDVTDTHGHWRPADGQAAPSLFHAETLGTCLHDESAISARSPHHAL